MDRYFRLSILGLFVSCWVAACGGGGGGGSGNGGSDATPVATVTIVPVELTLSVGESQQLTATTKDAAGNTLTGRTVSWSTSNAAAATVSMSGTVSGIAPGNATITATSEGQNGTAAITVEAAAVASVAVTPSAVTIAVGATRQLNTIVRDASGNVLNGRTITWSSSDSNVATVSSAGLVEGLSIGAARVTATSEGKSGTADVSVVAAVSYSSAVTGGAHSCALGADGAAYCWGRGESGQLGIAPPSTTCLLDAGSYPCSLRPVRVTGNLRFTQLAGGGAHTCGLTSDGTAYCWGNNEHGQLGDDSSSNRHAPVAVASTLSFASIDAGASHTCALTSGGVGYCWGRNDRGQLGDDTTTARDAPAAVVGGHVFESLVAGGFEIGHTCALVNGGNAYCWGDNERGQLGLGSADLNPHDRPVLVFGVGPFASITTGLGRHTCAFTDAGAAYCWGENSFGALGSGSTSDSSSPVAVQGGLIFEGLIAGGFIGHTCGRIAGGTAYCWGENERGQVGDGSTIDRLEPSPVAGGLSFTDLDAGFRHTCGWASTGSLYCWGSGAAGQLGRDSTAHSNVPVAVLPPESP